MKQSKTYQKTLKMVKSKERSKQFKKNIDSFTAQKKATRCFDAFKEKLYNPKVKVKFKKYGTFNSLEGKSNGTGIKYRGKLLKWKRLDIPILVKRKTIMLKKLKKIKYCRVLRKTISGGEL